MKLDINRILDRIGDTETVSAKVDLKEFNYRGVSPFNDPIALSGEVANRTGVITINFTYEYTLHLVCDRCLTPFTHDVKQQVIHTVVRELNSADDDDYVVVPNGIVELIPLATNDIILSLPAKFLCTDDCKGLCIGCGCDLNRSACSCEAKPCDPRLAILDKFFED